MDYRVNAKPEAQTERAEITLYSSRWRNGTYAFGALSGIVAALLGVYGDGDIAYLTATFSFCCVVSIVMASTIMRSRLVLIADYDAKMLRVGSTEIAFSDVEHVKLDTIEDSELLALIVQTPSGDQKLTSGSPTMMRKAQSTINAMKRRAQSKS